MDKDLANLAAKVACLQANADQQSSRLRQIEEWVDVVSSPLYKRLYFWLRGWRWKELGRWRGGDGSRWPGPTHRWWLR